MTIGGASITRPARYSFSDGKGTHKGVFELASRIGRTSWKLLLDLGSTGNCLSTQMCMVDNLKVEKDPIPNQLTMDNSFITQTDGKVQVKFKRVG